MLLRLRQTARERCLSFLVTSLSLIFVTINVTKI